jgi:hypothetical protein
MEFAGPDTGKADCRWVAVRHGLSTNGNDHIHIAVSLVREDRTKASVHNDRPGHSRSPGTSSGNTASSSFTSLNGQGLSGERSPPSGKQPNVETRSRWTRSASNGPYEQQPPHRRMKVSSSAG